MDFINITKRFPQILLFKRPRTVIVLASFLAVLISVHNLYTAKGATTVVAAIGLENKQILAVLNSPVDANTIFAGTLSNGIYKSTDRGLTWFSSNSSNVANLSVYALAFDPTNAGTLFAGTDSGLFKSTTGGGTWVPMNHGVSTIGIRSLALYPGDPNIIYAGSFINGMLKTTDGGANWQKVNNGISNSEIIPAVAVDQTNPNIVTAGTVFNGLLKSFDGGQSWVRTNQSVDLSSIGSIVVVPSNSNLMYLLRTGGETVYKSLNGGLTLFPSHSGIPNNFGTGLALDPKSPNVLYASASGNLYRTTDSANNWLQIPVTIPIQGSNNITATALNTVDETTIYVGTKSGLYVVSQDYPPTIPTVTITSPADGTAINSHQVVVTGTAADSSLGSGIVSVTVNGAQASFDNNTGRFIATIQAQADGPLTITATSKNKAGIDSLPSISNVLIDTAPPAITIDSPGEGDSVSGADITITGTVSDAGSGLAQVVVNHNRATVTDNKYSVKIGTNCNAGSILLTAEAIDAANNTTTVTRHITISNSAPNSPCVFNIGPDGASIRSLVFDPTNSSILYAGTEKGAIFKSIDGGTNWRALNTGFPNTGLVKSIAIDPTKTTTIYAAVDSGGVFKSSDGGDSWIASAQGIFDSSVRVVTIDSHATNTLYAGANFGAFKSTNGGTTWTQMSSFPGISSTFSFVVDPSNSNVIYAGAAGGVYKSINAGATWQVTNTGLPTGNAVISLVVDPINTNNLYAATQAGTVYKSTNGGSNWVVSNNGLTVTRPNVLAIDPNTPSTLYLGSDSGLFKTTDGAANWSSVNNGLGNTTVRALAINPSNHFSVYAGTAFGIFKSTNAGNGWAYSSSGLQNSTIREIAIDPANPRNIYAASDLGGVLKSSNGGTTWTNLNFGLPDNPSISAFGYVNSANPALYAGVSSNGIGQGVFKSVNDGGIWNPANGAFIYGTGIFSLGLTNDANVFYVGASGGLYKTTDGGNSYATLAGLGASVQRFAIDPTDQNIVYAGTVFGALFKSTNAGATWNRMGLSGNGGVTSLTIDPNDNQTIYATLQYSRLFKSSDAGLTWTQIDISEPAVFNQNLYCYSFTIDPSDSNNLYAGTTQGVFKSRDKGATWKIAANGLGQATIYALAIDKANPKAIFAGSDNGIYLIQEQNDLTPPTIALTTPANGGFANTRKIFVSGTVQDGAFGSGVASVMVNGTAAAIDTDNNFFTATVTAPSDGPFTVSAIATDNANNVSQPVISTVTIDTELPLITITSPAGGSTVSPGPLQVTGTINDAGSGIAAVVVNNVAASVNGNNYSATINLPCGKSFVITARAVDKVGNVGTVTRTVGLPVSSQTLPCSVSYGPEGGNIKLIVIDPTNPSVIYAGSSNGGIFKSTNAAASWFPVNTGITDLTISAIAISPSNSNILFAGTKLGSLFKSTNGGQSWNAIAIPSSISVPGITNSPINGLAIDTLTPSVVYVSTFTDIFKTLDGGNTWLGVTPEGPGYFNGIALDPLTTSTIYAATQRGTFKSIDGGATWTARNNITTDSFPSVDPPEMLSITIDSKNPSTIYEISRFGRVYKSIDGAASWQEINVSFRTIGSFFSFPPTQMTVDPTNSNIVYAVSSVGVFRSSDGGNHWADVSGNLTGLSANVIAVDPSNPNVLYVGSVGVNKSYSGGGNWQNSFVGIVASHINGLTGDLSNPDVFYAGVSGFGLWKSTDGGSNFAESAGGIFVVAQTPPFRHSQPSVLAITLDRNNPGRIYVATNYGIFKSIDSGTSWQQITGSSSGPFLSLVLDPNNSQTIYATGFGFYRSTDGGNTFIPTGNGDTSFASGCLAIDPVQSNIVYTCAQISGIVKTVDSGVTWNTIPGPVPGVTETALLVDPLNTSTIYAGTFTRGFFVSTDGGSSWSSRNTGLPDLADIVTLAMDPVNTQIIYAGTSRGAFKTTNGGNNWQALDGVPSSVSISSIAVDPVRRSTVYVGLTAGGVYVVQQQPQPSDASAAIYRLNPAKAVVGQSDIDIDISGGGFVPTSFVQWNGSPLMTRYVNSAKLIATIPAANLAQVTSASITVVNPAPGGATTALPFDVVKTPASLSITNLNQIYDGTPRRVSVSSNPVGLTGIKITYNGAITEPVDAGTYDVISTLDNTLFASPPVSGTLTIAKADQSLSLTQISDKTMYDAPFQLNGTVTSGLPITYGATGGVSISGNTVTITGTGSATITASQAGNNNYNAASSVSRTFNINNPLPQILRLNPGAIVAGRGQTILKVSGSNFVTDSLVKINGVNSPAIFVNRIELDVPLSAADLATPGNKTIMISNPAPGGGNSIPVTLTIISTTSSDTKNIQPGTTDMVSNAPTQSGDAGITAQLTHSQSAGGPATVTVEQYSGDPLGGSGLIDAGGGYVDLKVTGADPNDILNATFYYGSNVTGANEDKLQLLYFNGTKWAKVRSSGNTNPIKNTTDNQDGTVSGGTFRVVFDETSSPKLSQLTGTIFRSTSGLYGDMNGDTVVNVNDLILMANFLAGNISVDQTAADLNQDGKVTVNDLLTLANFLAGNTARLPVSSSP